MVRYVEETPSSVISNRKKTHRFRWLQILVRLQFPAEAMHAHTIAKDFKEVLEPTAIYEYSDLPPLVGEEKKHTGKLLGE